MKKLDIHIPCGSSPFHREAVQKVMEALLPSACLTGETPLEPFLPAIGWSAFSTPPYYQSFFLLTPFRTNAFRFFCEMVCRWLLPEQRKNAYLQFAVDFALPSLSSQFFIAGEVVIRIESEKELRLIEKNLPVLKTEIRLGVDSPYHANRILEIKGLTSDEKTALIQDSIASLVRRRPQDFDYDIFSDMQHFLVLCREGFKSERCFKHMSRIICVHYLFRKALRHSYEAFPDRRYVSLKPFCAHLGDKKVLAIALGVSFLRNNEVLEERHLLSAVKELVSEVRAVPGSFLCHTVASDPIKTFYFEIEKISSERFSIEETRVVRYELPTLVKNRIEERMSPLFMPENEEETMRDILSLGQQVKYVRDLPHAIINFHRQTEKRLEFIVVLVRVLTAKTVALTKLLERKTPLLEVHLGRMRILGNLRKKYPKEAAVFRLGIEKSDFLRQDHSLDLYKARQEVAAHLQRLIGEFRDYNGGMLTKETEHLQTLYALLGPNHAQDAFLLENFFYSLSPAVMRSVLPSLPLKKLFLMLLAAQDETPSEHYVTHIDEDKDFYYILLTSRDESFRIPLMEKLTKLAIPHLATAFVSSTKYPCFAICLRRSDPTHERAIRQAVEEVCHQEIMV